MRKNKYNIILLILLVFISVFKILINEIPTSYAYLINIIFWGLLAVGLFLMGGFPRNKNYYEKNSVRIVFIFFLFNILVIYLLGLFVGFVKNLYFYNLILLIKKVLPIILFIVFSEVVRYLFFKHNSTKLQKVLFGLGLVILNIIIETNGYKIIDAKHLFVVISSFIIPIIVDEAICSYMTYNVGVVPSILYKLLFKLYIYIVPFVPDLGDYLKAILGVIIPYIIYVEIKKCLSYKEKYGIYAKKRVRNVFCSILLLFLSVIILLISGIFKYQLIAIATGSMEPIYYRGDAVIVERVELDTIEVGDILVYNSSGGIITHRVIEINKKNGELIFHTKGDNNLTDDKLDVKEDEVRGIVKYVVKYVGYPTIIFNEFLEGK